MNRDLTTSIRVAKCVLPQTATVTKTGTDVNLKQYESATFEIAIGTAGDTLSTTAGGPSQTWVFQHADDDGAGSPGAYAAAVAADLIDDPAAAVLSAATVLVNSTASSARVYQIGYIGAKQWVRVVMQTTGTHTTGTQISANVIKGHARVFPATA